MGMPALSCERITCNSRRPLAAVHPSMSRPNTTRYRVPLCLNRPRTLVVPFVSEAISTLPPAGRGITRSLRRWSRTLCWVARTRRGSTLPSAVSLRASHAGTPEPFLARLPPRLARLPERAEDRTADGRAARRAGWLRARWHGRRPSRAQRQAAPRAAQRQRSATADTSARPHQVRHALCDALDIGRIERHGFFLPPNSASCGALRMAREAGVGFRERIGSIRVSRAGGPPCKKIPSAPSGSDASSTEWTA